MAKSTGKPDVIESPANLEDFLRGCEGKGAVRISAKHQVAGKEQAEDVCDFEPQSIDDDNDTKRFSGDQIYEKLLQDAENIGGVQRYVLYAFRENSKTPCDRHGVRIDAGSADTSVGEPMGNSLQAALALVKQSHDFNERFMRSMQNLVQGTVGGLAKQSELLMKELEKAHDERVSMWELLGAINKNDRETKQLEAKIAKDEKKDAILADGAKLLLPAIINKLAPSEHIKAEGVTRLIESLTDEQKAIIFASLNEQQRLALGGLLDKKIEEREAEAKNGKS